MKQCFLPLALTLWVCMLGAEVRAERTVVLVTNASCAIESLTMLEIRKAYFGLTLSGEKDTVRAYRLTGDEALSQVFYQAVVAMSEKSYQQRLMSMLLKFGKPRPTEFGDVNDLFDALRRSDCGIAYIWGEGAIRADGIKVLRLIWEGK